MDLSRTAGLSMAYVEETIKRFKGHNPNVIPDPLFIQGSEMQKVIPILMEVGGEKKTVGQALIESDSTGDIFVHAVLESDETVANMFRGMHVFSIANKDGDGN